MKSNSQCCLIKKEKFEWIKTVQGELPHNNCKTAIK